MSTAMFSKPILRRDFLLNSAGTLLAIPGLRGLPWAMPDDTNSPQVKKRLVIMFTPNGMVADGFWPQTEGSDFEMEQVLKPLEPFREQTLVVKGISNLIRGDGDNHMRGMSCLLTGNELFPGNVQGGSDTPAGWAKGISIDQEIKNYLQSQTETKTRFGSLEFGVRVPNEANPWTRMVYAGPNQPVAPISDPYRMFDKMYGQIKGRENLLSVLDLVQQDFDHSKAQVDPRDQHLLNSNQKFIRQMQADLKTAGNSNSQLIPIKLPANVPLVNDSMPALAKMQMDLVVSGFTNDLNRISSLQFTRSVGDAKMRWLGVEQGHHALSHEPDKNKEAQDKLLRINTWYCEQLVYLAQRLQETREPGTEQSMLDNTLIVWTNELGHGNSHSLHNLPMVMVGGGFGFEMGRYTKVDNVSTTRLWLAIAQAMGHKIDIFGLAKLCQDGPVVL
jgi:hypothetical protein